MVLSDPSGIKGPEADLCTRSSGITWKQLQTLRILQHLLFEWYKPIKTP